MAERSTDADLVRVRINSFGVKETDGCIANLRAGTTNFSVGAPGIFYLKKNKVSGFVFKVQANYGPPKHPRPRCLLSRLASAILPAAMKLTHVRSKKVMSVTNPVNVPCRRRASWQRKAWGRLNIIGISHHGQLRIGDTLDRRRSDPR